LGRFGTSVARTLHSLGYDVTAIDLEEQRVEDAAEYVALSAQGDGTDEEVLRQLQIDRADVAIVAQASNLEASVLTTLILKKIGVPWVVAKARTELHGEILSRIGADRVIFPERDAGVRLAHAVAVRHINDYITLSPTSGIAKFSAPSNFEGQTLAELLERCQGKLSVLAIARNQRVIAAPSFGERIERGDELVVVGPDTEIENFVERGIDSVVPAR
jgi:trk system potassium uptake protein TrkA